MLKRGAYSSHLLALIIILITLAVLWTLAQKNNFLMCDANCGETIMARNAAADFVKNGIHSTGLLERVGGTVEEPLLYTHNVNLGSLTFVAMEALGIHDFSSKILLPFFAFGGGLFYIFLSVRLFARSASAGIITLLVFASTYWGLSFFAFNALRAWHIFAFWGVIYHVGRLTGQPWQAPGKNFLGLAIAASIAFGCGYDFWMPCGCVAGMILLARQPLRLNRRFVLLLASIGGAFLFPFLLRQGQILGVLGFDYLLHDLYYSIAIKIPYAAQLLSAPSIEEIDRYYALHHVYRPPATPANDMGQIYHTFQAMLRAVTLPRWGIITLINLVGAIGAASWIFLAERGRFKSSTKKPMDFFTQIKIDHALTDLLLPVFLGTALGMAIFLPFSLHVYLKHEFPLVGFVFLLAKGLTLYALWNAAKGEFRPWMRVMFLLSIGVFIGDAAMVHRNNSRYASASTLGWLSFASAHPQADFLLSWHPPAALEIPDINDFATTPPGEAIKTIAHLKGRAGLRAPDYWIYQPDSQSVNFDAQIPSCQWHDWLLKTLPPNDHILFSKPWVTPRRITPNALFSFGGTISGFDPATETLKLAASPPLNGDYPIIYNCIYHSVIGWAKIGRAASPQIHVALSVEKNSGAVKELHDFSIPVDPSTSVSSSALMPSPDLPDPSIAQVVAAAPEWPIAERTDRYVIFDLTSPSTPGHSPAGGAVAKN